MLIELTDDQHLHIVHCDLDAFFASVEQRDDPTLQGQPVVVGGHPNSRGVVSTCSYEARKFGIHSAMPLSGAHALCPQAVFLPVDFPKYIKASKEVFAIMAQFSPILEPLSIDEAFLDVRGCNSLFGSAAEIGMKIRKTVKDELDLNISIGVSYNKFLAKLATDLAKPNGMKIIRQEETIEILRPLPVSCLWGAGQESVKRLHHMGLFKIADIQDLPASVLEEKLGQSGRLFWELAHGIDDRKLEPDRERKSIGKEITFESDLSDADVLDQTLLYFAQVLGRQIRSKGLKAKTVTLKIRFFDFQTLTRSRSLTVYSSSELDYYNCAKELLAALPKSAKKVRLLGLHLSNLAPRMDIEQGLLFADDQQVHEQKVEEVLDELCNRFGNQVITRARLLHKPQEKNK